ncbi:tripartite tricarboxylate transporter permease [Staphylococcus arlettae]|uniref:tripartite tricarboxylate transporter permease n=1 Tax=Staphylococcus arlettae TaxID=29378 RepID=UPI001E5EB00F|nr:tripartite tricarboxylate transporter permease [Staphylococcus arlettae]MCD8838514.1 tripartite tricarboxylate transporter permease [Staphylococcus arlettae]MCD8866417.1 tripartite tricarboxylate transporter permease [Staphylococcus arlettae]
MHLDLLKDSFLTILEPTNLMLVILGLLVGIFLGALPGIGSSMAIVLALPFTYFLDVVPAIALLATIYVGSAYGGSITAILFNTPGTPEAVATTFDGYPMTQKGQSRKALGLAISASAFGGIFAVLIMMFLSPILSQLAFKIHSSEYFALALLGMTVISSLGTSNKVKAIVSGLLGIFISTVGIDPLTATDRFTFNTIELMNGIDYIPIMIGAFALGEVFSQLTAKDPHNIENTSTKSTGVFKIKDFFVYKWAAAKSAVIGTLIGILPGTGGAIASFVSYGVTMKTDKNSDDFGKGKPEGVVAPETANNAAAAGSMIPTFILGIPGSATTAVILAALVLQGVQPGPQLLSDQPILLYAILLAMLFASIMTFIAGRAGIQIFSLLLKAPYSIIATFIIMLSLIGAYATNNDLLNIWIMLLFGVVGYLMKVFNFSIASLILGIVLGPLMETSLRRHLLLNNGDYFSLLHSPITVVILLISVLIIVVPIVTNKIQAKS